MLTLAISLGHTQAAGQPDLVMGMNLVSRTLVVMDGIAADWSMDSLTKCLGPAALVSSREADVALWAESEPLGTLR